MEKYILGQVTVILRLREFHWAGSLQQCSLLLCVAWRSLVSDDGRFKKLFTFFNLHAIIMADSPDGWN